jgi:hypothetical protein
MDNEFARSEWQRTLAGWHRLLLMLATLTLSTGALVMLFWRDACVSVLVQAVGKVVKLVG